MALSVGDNTANTVNHGAGVNPNPQQGTILVLIKLASTTFSDFRTIYKKGGAGTSGDGTVFGLSGNLRFSRARASGNQTVDFPAASLTTDWQWMAWTFDITNGGPKAYSGGITGALTDVTTSASDGAGAAADHSADLFRVFTNHVPAASLAATIARLYVYSRDLSSAEISAQRFRFAPVDPTTCHLLCEYGFQGTATAQDFSGRGNHGTITGAAVAAHAPIFAPFRWHQEGDEYRVAAAPGGGVARSVFHSPVFRSPVFRSA